MTLLQAGRGLLSYNSPELYSVAAHLLIESSVQTKEEAEARSSTIGNIRRQERERLTGVPAVTELYRPADEMYEAT